MGTALTTSNLSIGYSHNKNTKTVAQNININLQQGKLTCLMGPNGIGKSTLIKTLTGVLPPLAGEVIIGDDNITGLNHLQKAQSISVVLTERPAAGYMDVHDLICLGRFPYTNWQNNFNNKDVEIVNQAIDAVSLADQAHTPLSELSDGNFQKAIIGRALAQDTAILVLDEPTIHLDVNNKTIVIKLLRKLSRQANKSILLSTHDLDLAMNFADKLWLFAEDKIIEGLPEDLALNGSLQRVFSETNNDEQSSDEHFSAIDFGGDEQGIILIKQALAKYGLPEQIDKLSKIEVKISEFNCKITYKQNIYLSVEEFLDSLHETI